MLKKVNIAFKSQTQCATLAQNAKICQSASNSCVLSLVNHLLDHNLQQSPPNFQTKLKNSIKLKKTTKPDDIHKSYLLYYQIWCDYLVDLIEKKQALRYQDTLYFIDDVPDEFIKKIRKGKCWKLIQKDNILNNNLNNPNYYQKIALIFDVIITQEPRKNVGIANLGTSQLKADLFYPKIHLPGLISGIWFNNQQWKTYYILKNQYPTQQQFNNLDTIFLTGSSLSINGNNPEVQLFLKKLKIALAKNPKLKVVGLCFGHQAIAKMYGASVVRKNWVGGIHGIQFNFDQIRKYQENYFSPLLENLSNDKNQNILNMTEFHSDYVVTVPNNFHVIASSQSCQIESLYSKDKRIITFQFHPEYLYQYSLFYQLRLNNYNGIPYKKLESLLLQQTMREKFIKHEQSVNKIRQVIFGFIQ